MIETARMAHERRVSAYSREIAFALGLIQPGFEAALAISIKNMEHTLKRAGVDRLLVDLGVIRSQSEPSSDVVQSKSYVTSIVDMASAFDNELEMSAYSDLPLSKLFKVPTDESPATSFVLSALRKCSEQDLARLIPKLPVLPNNALSVLRALGSKDVTATTIATLASKDQVLAGGLLAAANSAAMGSRTNITNLCHAAAYIGTQRAATILLALALRPVLVGGQTNDMWNHSVEAAAAAEKMSSLCEGLSPSDGYVLGLIHDVGRLLLAMVPKAAAAVRDRLIRSGCELSVAELIVCGMDHAEAGALVLRHWGLPDRFIEAVLFHHQPQQTESNLAALLYLVEFWTDSEEDPASNVRLQAALQRLKLSAVDVINMPAPKPTLPI